MLALVRSQPLQPFIRIPGSAHSELVLKRIKRKYGKNNTSAEITKKVSNRLLADDARTTANTTTKFLYRIYKEINEASSEGITQLVWNIEGFSNRLVNAAKEDLVDAGYLVTTQTYYDEQASKEIPTDLVIMW